MTETFSGGCIQITIKSMTLLHLCSRNCVTALVQQQSAELRRYPIDPSEAFYELLAIHQPVHSVKVLSLSSYTVDFETCYSACFCKSSLHIHFFFASGYCSTLISSPTPHSYRHYMCNVSPSQACKPCRIIKFNHCTPISHQGIIQLQCVNAFNESQCCLCHSLLILKKVYGQKSPLQDLDPNKDLSVVMRLKKLEKKIEIETYVWSWFQF